MPLKIMSIIFINVNRLYQYQYFVVKLDSAIH